MHNGHGGDIYSHPDVIDFSANLNPFGTPIRVIKGLQEKCHHLCAYPDVACRQLKAAIAHKHHLAKEMIICSNGAAELFYILVRAKKPKKVLLVEPSFSEYRKACESVNAEVVTYLLKEEQSFDLDDSYCEALKEEIDMAFLCTPNNPTGRCIDMRLLEEMIQICNKKQIFLVIDESFFEFTGKNDKQSVMSLISQNKHLFIVKSFTKLYAIAGVRLGYGICEDQAFLEQLESVRQPWGVSSIAQEAGILCLKEQAYAQNSIRLLKEERQYLEWAFNRLGIKYIPSEANFILFQGPENLKEKLLKKGILIRDCSNYWNLKKGYFRIAVRSRQDNEVLIGCLKEIFQR